MPAISWWSDYSAANLDLVRHYAGQDRENKVKEHEFPSEAQIQEDILPTFKDNPVIHAYISSEANQHNFANAAESEVKARLNGSGFTVEASTKSERSLEFRRMNDASVDVYEIFDLIGPLLNIETGGMLETEGGGSIANVRLSTNIREHSGEISHTILRFEFEIINVDICRELFKCEYFSALLSYVPNEQKYLCAEPTEKLEAWEVFDDLDIEEAKSLLSRDRDFQEQSADAEQEVSPGPITLMYLKGSASTDKEEPSIQQKTKNSKDKVCML